MADGTVMFKIDSCIRGYHIHSTIWTNTLGKYISCVLELVNAEGSYPEAVMLINTVVVHLFRVLPVCAALLCLLYIS